MTALIASFSEVFRFLPLELGILFAVLGIICANCGQDVICKNCGYSEPPIWMQSRHDFETEVALADNVQTQMASLWEGLQRTIANGNTPLKLGAYVYKLTKPSPNAPSGRTVRIPITIYKAPGNTFSRPKNYTERRASDNKSMEGYPTSYRIKRNVRHVNLKIDGLEVA